MTIRPETAHDLAGILAVHAAAFPTEDEAKLVDALRACGRLVVSLVCETGKRIVGHVAFSPVTVDGVAGGLGLAPVAVLPEFQRKGIGGLLVREGLAAAAQTGAGYCVVLGHPEYYPKFGIGRRRRPSVHPAAFRRSESVAEGANHGRPSGEAGDPHGDRSGRAGQVLRWHRPPSR